MKKECLLSPYGNYQALEKNTNWSSLIFQKDTHDGNFVTFVSKRKAPEDNVEN